VSVPNVTGMQFPYPTYAKGRAVARSAPWIASAAAVQEPLHHGESYDGHSSGTMS